MAYAEGVQNLRQKYIGIQEPIYACILASQNFPFVVV